MNRRILVFAALSVMMLGLVWTTTAQEHQRSDEAFVEIRFWAFSANPQFFAYQTTNHNEERAFVVGQVGSPEPAFIQPADDSNSPRDILISQEVRDTYGWNSSGTEGNPSPSGFTEIQLRETGATLSVTARQGRTANPVGVINRLTDQTGTELATGAIIKVLWSDDEAVAVVILEQRLAGGWPLRVQTAHGFAIPQRPLAP